MATKDYGGVEVGLTGSDELVAGLRAFAEEFPSAAHAALLAEVEAVIPMLREDAPIGASGDRHRGDTHPGRLRASAHVSDPGSDNLAVALVMGGEDVGVPYGVAQETKPYQHPHGGERYFFADDLQAERPLFTDRLGAQLMPKVETLGGRS